MSEFVAITRAVSPAMAQCELTHLPRAPIDIENASAQHDAYERALERLGCSVRRLPAGTDMPDAVFIEDTAVALDEVAVIMRPGASSRRGETAAVADALRAYRPIVEIQAPDTMDGGDVLVIGRSIFVGCSSRTTAAAIEQLRRFLAPSAYSVQAVAVRGCLHLKSAVTAVSDHAVLMNPRWVSPDEFRGFDIVKVDPDEPWGANIVSVHGRLLYAAAFPRTRDRLEGRGDAITVVNMSEIAKAEGAVTCCSVILRAGETV